MWRKKNYIIKRGHSKASGLNVKLYKGNPSEYWDIMIRSGWHKADADPGKTKICGFTIGLLPKIKKYDKSYSVSTKLPLGYCLLRPTHWNSRRTAIQPDYKEKGVWNVYSYNYVNGIRKVRKLFSTPEGVEFHAKINRPLKLTKRAFGWFCYPYYEGDDVAPVDIKLYLDRH